MTRMPPRPNTKLGPAVRPSAALQSMYQRQLDELIDEMQKSISWWLAIAYRIKPPEMAADAKGVPPKYRGSPTMVMQRVMARLARRWQKRFDEAAPELARYFTTKIKDRSDAVLAGALKQGGYTVKLKLTPQVNDTVQASVQEQILLIKDLGAQHLTDISQMVMRSVAEGGDLKALSDGLRKRYGITKRRAELISRDQNSKATALITRARQDSLGITQALWVHSSAGKVPRPSHVEAGREGTVYNIKEGWPDPDLGGKRIWPGTEINCRCFARPILPVFN